MMAACKSLKANREFDVTRANNVLDLEVGELRVEPELLNDPSVLS